MNASFSKVTNKDKAPLKKSYTLYTKRPIFISAIHKPSTNPHPPPYEKPKKIVNFSSSHYKIHPKSSTSFLIFTPKKYDLHSKAFQEELKTSSTKISSQTLTTKISEAQQSFNSDLTHALSIASHDLHNLQQLEILPSSCHLKAKEFLDAIKNDDAVLVKELLVEHPELRNTTDITQQNAMHWACRRAGSDVIEALLKAGVNWKHPDMVHRLPQRVAEKCGNSQALAILRRISSARRRGPANTRSLLHLRTKLIKRATKNNKVSDISLDFL